MKRLLFLLAFIFTSLTAFSQSTTLTPGATGNVQLPKMSYEQIKAIPNPKAGMMVFDSTFKCLKYFDGNDWFCSTQNSSNASVIGFAWQKKNNNSLFKDNASDITVDYKDNAYISGWLMSGTIAPYAAKVSPIGSLVWEYVDYNGSSAVGGTSIKLDNESKVYFMSNSRYQANGLAEVVKLSENGRREWSATIFSDYGAMGTEVFVDDFKNTYITGYFNGTIRTSLFSVTPQFSITATVQDESFIAKISPEGTFLWLKRIGKSKVKVSSNGDVYFAAVYRNSINIEGNMLYSAGGDDILLGKILSNGSLAWIKRAGGTGDESVSAITLDYRGDTYITGGFSGASDFDGNVAQSVDLKDFYIVKYRSDGTFQWVRNGGGIGDDTGNHIEISPEGNPIVSGWAGSASATFYPNTTINFNGLERLFLGKYDSDNGDIIYIKPFSGGGNLFKVASSGKIYTAFSCFTNEGTLIYTQPHSGSMLKMALGSLGHIFFAGNFRGTIRIGSCILSTSDEGDIFVSHWLE